MGESAPRPADEQKSRAPSAMTSVESAENSKRRPMAVHHGQPDHEEENVPMAQPVLEANGPASDVDLPDVAWLDSLDRTASPPLTACPSAPAGQWSTTAVDADGNTTNVFPTLAAPPTVTAQGSLVFPWSLHSAAGCRPTVEVVDRSGHRTLSGTALPSPQPAFYGSTLTPAGSACGDVVGLVHYLISGKESGPHGLVPFAQEGKAIISMDLLDLSSGSLVGTVNLANLQGNHFSGVQAYQSWDGSEVLVFLRTFEPDGATFTDTLQCFSTADGSAVGEVIAAKAFNGVYPGRHVATGREFATPTSLLFVTGTSLFIFDMQSRRFSAPHLAAGFPRYARTPVLSRAFSATHKAVVVADPITGHVAAISAEDGSPVATIDLPQPSSAVTSAPGVRFATRQSAATSPDGTRMAVADGRVSGGGIWVMGLPGLTDPTLVLVGTSVAAVAWAPGGQHLWALSAGERHLTRVGLDGEVIFSIPVASGTTRLHAPTAGRARALDLPTERG